MVYCIRKFNGAVEKGHKKIKTRKMKNFNEEAFLADVSGICWEQMLTETDDINVLVNYWSEMFSLIIEKHAPLIEMRVSEKYCPWIDKDLRDLMRTRGKLKKNQQSKVNPQSLWTLTERSVIRSMPLMLSCRSSIIPKGSLLAKVT